MIELILAEQFLPSLRRLIGKVPVLFRALACPHLWHSSHGGDCQRCFLDAVLCFEFYYSFKILALL